jgi:hypothetical protein
MCTCIMLYLSLGLVSSQDITEILKYVTRSLQNNKQTRRGGSSYFPW